MEQLSGRTALITGGSRGIGKALALALAREGVQVGITGRTEVALSRTVEEIKQLGSNAAYAVADVANRAAAEAAASTLSATLGGIDILVNNAGIGAFGNFTEMPAEQWEEIVKVNLFGVYYVTRAVLPGMIARQSGDIINISSTAGQRGNASTTAYSASKFAVMGLTEALLMEVRKYNIRVTVLAPSTVATDMAISDLKITDGNPQKVLQPEDIAELVVAQLKLNRRAFVKSNSIWSTNP